MRNQTYAKIGAVCLAIVDLLIQLQRLLLPSISLLAPVAENPVLSATISWTVICLLYLIAGRDVYRNANSSTALSSSSQCGLTVLFALVGVGFGLAFHRMIAGTQEVLLRAGIWMLALILSATGLFIAYLLVAMERPWFGETGSFGRTAMRFYVSDLQRQFIQEDVIPTSGTGWHARLKQAKLVLFVGLVFALPAMAAGILADPLQRSSPFPDVILLLWVFLDPKNRALVNTDGSPRPEPDEPDIGSQLVSGLRLSLRNFKGAILVLFILLVAVASGTGFWHAFSFFSLFRDPEFVAVATSYPFGGGIILWNIIGSMALLSLAGGYGLWIAVQETRYLSVFLDSYEQYGLVSRLQLSVHGSGSSEDATQSSTNPDSQVPTLPFHVLVPHVLVATVGTFWTAAMPTLSVPFSAFEGAEKSVVYGIWLVFAFLWPVLAVCTLILVRTIRSQKPLWAGRATISVVPFIGVAVLVSHLSVIVLFIAYAALSHFFPTRMRQVRRQLGDFIILGSVWLLADAYGNLPGTAIGGSTWIWFMFMSVLLILYPEIERLTKDTVNQRTTVWARRGVVLGAGLVTAITSIPLVLKLLIGLQLLVIYCAGISRMGRGPVDPST